MAWTTREESVSMVTRVGLGVSPCSGDLHEMFSESEEWEGKVLQFISYIFLIM